jgi:zinc protease
MEARVKRLFSTIPDGERIPKGVYPVPAMDGPVFENIIDPDVKYQTLKIFHRLPYPSKEVRKTSEYWKEDFEKQIISQIIGSRFNNAEKDPSCPTEIAVAVTTPSMHHFYVSQFTLSPKEEGQLEDILRFYETEIGSLLRHGFTKEEFEVAKAAVWKNNRLDEEVSREDIENEQIVNVCIENFLNATPMVLEHDLLDIKRAALNEVTYEAVAEYLPEMIGCKEKIYTYTVGTDKTHLLPSVDRMKEIIAEVAKENIGPKFVEYKKMDLVKDVTPGKVTKKKAIKGMDGEVWTLCNGAKVYWMPIDPIKSSTHLTLEARFDTGYKTWNQSEIARSAAASTFITRNLGFGNCSSEDVSNDPVCGRVRAFTHTREGSSSFNLHCSRYDVETAFTMFYNFLTRPYFNSQEALDKYIEMNLKNLGREETSKSKFINERKKVRYDGHPWIVEPDSSSYTGLDFKFIEETFNRNYGNPEEMTVFICTDLDKESIFPLVEKYIASLQKDKTYKKAKIEPLLPVCKGEVKFDRTYPIVSAPKVDVDYQFYSTVKDNLKNKIAFDILDHIMSERCLTRIREERGGTYTVNFSSDSFGYKGRHLSEITFQTRPEMEEILLKDAQELMDQMCQTGPTEEEMDAAVKYLIKSRKEKQQKNANLITWKMMERKTFISSGIPFEFDLEKIAKSFSAKDIQKLAAKVNNGDRFISIYREQ